MTYFYTLYVCKGRSVSHKWLQFNTCVPNGLEFATVGGYTFHGGFTLQIDCTYIKDVCLEWSKLVTVLQECTIREQLAVVCFLWVKAHLANNIHKYMHSVYGMNCLSPKAVYNWVQKFAHGHSKQEDTDTRCCSVKIVRCSCELVGSSDWSQQMGKYRSTVGCSHVLAYSKMHDWPQFWIFCTRWAPRELNLGHNMTSNLENLMEIWYLFGWRVLCHVSRLACMHLLLEMKQLRVTLNRPSEDSLSLFPLFFDFQLVGKSVNHLFSYPPSASLFSTSSHDDPLGS
jgi:hypothetical protein